MALCVFCFFYWRIQIHAFVDIVDADNDDQHVGIEDYDGLYLSTSASPELHCV